MTFQDVERFYAVYDASPAQYDKLSKKILPFVMLVYPRVEKLHEETGNLLTLLTATFDHAYGTAFFTGTIYKNVAFYDMVKTHEQEMRQQAELNDQLEREVERRLQARLNQARPEGQADVPM